MTHFHWTWSLSIHSLKHISKLNDAPTGTKIDLSLTIKVLKW